MERDPNATNPPPHPDLKNKLQAVMARYDPGKATKDSGLEAILLILGNMASQLREVVAGNRDDFERVFKEGIDKVMACEWQWMAEGVETMTDEHVRKSAHAAIDAMLELAFTEGRQPVTWRPLSGAGRVPAKTETSYKIDTQAEQAD